MPQDSSEIVRALAAHWDLGESRVAPIASGLIHMLIKYHNSDYGKLSNEDEVSTALRNGSPAVGFYSLPHCVDMADMKKESVQERFAHGPVAFVAIFPNGMPNMGKLMGQQIAFFPIFDGVPEMEEHVDLVLLEEPQMRLHAMGPLPGQAAE